MAEHLLVFLNAEKLGTISLDALTDSYDLEYAPSWISEKGYPISPWLRPGAAPPESVKRFLANLLPEGKWLEELSLSQQISRNNIFGLVAAIGQETAGALTFKMVEESPGAAKTSFRPILPEELAERIAHRSEQSIAQWDGKPRLSIAGVQDKLPVLIKHDGTMGFGEGELASTHILKFGKRAGMHLVINEFICMELARKIGLPVAPVAIKRFGEPVLVVERFDRLWSGDRVERLHLIDGCQLLDLPPSYKYERPYGKAGEGSKIRTGVSLPRLFAAASMCRIPALAIKSLLNWTLFQLLISNSDAHGKNISFFVGSKGIDVAPAYDLLNLEVYADEYEHDLAMAVGSTFEIDSILPYQLAEMCEDCQLPQRQVATSLKTLCLALQKAVNSLDVGEILTEEEVSFALDLKERIRRNSERFLVLAEELPRVRL